MGGRDDLLRPDGAAVGDGGAGTQLQHLGMLTDPQVPGDGGNKFQRMELGNQSFTQSL